MTDEQRKEEITDAQVRLFVATGRMLKEAERVRNERERLLALVEDEGGNGDRTG